MMTSAKRADPQAELMRRLTNATRADPRAELLWHGRLGKFEAASAAMRASPADDPEETVDRLADAEFNAAMDLMETPATSPAAIARKLDVVLDLERGFYEEYLVWPVLLEVRRLLAD